MSRLLLPSPPGVTALAAGAVLAFSGCVAGSSDAIDRTGRAAQPNQEAQSSQGAQADDSARRDVLDAVAGLLDTRATAALARDRDAWDATIASGDASDATTKASAAETTTTAASQSQRLRDEYPVYAALPWQTMRYEDPRLSDVPSARGRDSAPELTVRVTVVSQLRDIEGSEQRGSETFRARQTPNGWRLSGREDSADLSRPWLLPGTRVVTGTSSLVVGTADQATLEAYAADADSAVARVAQLWPNASLQRAGAPARRPLVVVPATSAGFDALRRGAASSRPHEMAALTDGPPGADGRAVADRILVDPVAMSRLTREGRAFVVTHETAHVTWRAHLAGQAPIWLQEGFADWVGYEGTGLAPEVIATDALAAVRREGVPGSIPSTESFSAAGAAIQSEYQRSWVLVDLLIAQHGLPKILDLIEVATTQGAPNDAERAADAALASVLGTSRAEVTSAWQQRLASLAGSPATR